MEGSWRGIFEALSRQQPEEAEEYYQKPHSEKLVTWPGSELSTYRIRVHDIPAAY